MDCAARGTGTPCCGPAVRRCGLCDAVGYCSIAHQMSHWEDHKRECARLEKQMKQANVLHDFPFSFSTRYPLERGKRCSFLEEWGIHRVGMWKYECICGSSHTHSDDLCCLNGMWGLCCEFCPCTEPSSYLRKNLNSWEDYYQWRSLPLNSPVALLLHWPLTIYRGAQLSGIKMKPSQDSEILRIHYLGLENELFQLAVLGELHALFPGFKMLIDVIGPAVPHARNGERINLCSYAQCIDNSCVCKSLNNAWTVSSGSTFVSLRIHKGFYHDHCRDLLKDSFPDLIIAPNAGVAAYSSWLPTIELIKKMNVPAIFTDYCEEAANLAADCIYSITGRPLRVPIQLNPFRQPMMVEDSALYLPCYSNCFIFGF